MKFNINNVASVASFQPLRQVIIDSTCQTTGLPGVAARRKKMNKLLILGMFNRAGMKAFNEGRFEDALFQLNQAGMIAGRMKTTLHTAKVLTNMGLVHMGTGDLEAAKVVFDRAAVAAIEGAGSGNVLHRTIVRNMDQLAQVAA